MKVLGCAAARRRLQAYHDGELPIGDQIDVDAHLEWCEHCAALLDEMQVLRTALRTSLPGREELCLEDGFNMAGAVISRVRAEETASWPARLRSMFEDMHMVYAGLGAGTATVVCVMILAGMMRFATSSERSPGSNQNPVVVDARMLMPRPLEQVVMTAEERNADDAVFTLSAVVTREGRIVNLELHAADGTPLDADSTEARALQGLLGTVSRARFEPAKVSGLPVAVNMIWMVAHTTVRAAQTPLEVNSPTPAKRRRVAMRFPQAPAAPLTSDLA